MCFCRVVLVRPVQVSRELSLILSLDIVGDVQLFDLNLWQTLFVLSFFHPRLPYLALCRTLVPRCIGFVARAAKLD